VGESRCLTFPLLKSVWKSKRPCDDLPEPPPPTLARLKQECAWGCGFKALVPPVAAGPLPGFCWLNILQPSFPRCTLFGLSDLWGVARFVVHFHLAFLCRWMVNTAHRPYFEWATFKLEKDVGYEHYSDGCMHHFLVMWLCNCQLFVRAITILDRWNHV